jgi:serine/threonine-protein kinase
VAGIVHRDLKPDNLFVTYRDDNSPCVKIFDFGIAKVVAEGTAKVTRALGTPIYMSPEQIRGQASIGPRSDLLALAHIAYTLLVGEAYWYEALKGADSLFPLLTQIVAGVFEAPTVRARRRRGVALPPAFDAWMAKAIAVRQENRFDRATTQVAALAAALGVPWPRQPQPSLQSESVPGALRPAAIAATSPADAPTLCPLPALEPAKPEQPWDMAAVAGRAAMPSTNAAVSAESIAGPPAPPRPRAALSVAVAAGLLLVAGIGATDAVIHWSGGSAPAVSTVVMQTAAATPAPAVVPVETAEAGTAAPSAANPAPSASASPKATAAPTARPAVLVRIDAPHGDPRPAVTAKPTAAAAPFDPIRTRR